MSIQLSASNDGDADVIGSAVLSTLIGAATGGIVVMVVERFFPGRSKCWSLSKGINGSIAGKKSTKS